MANSAAEAMHLEPVSGLVITRLQTETSYKEKAYAALKDAILRMDLLWIDG